MASSALSLHFGRGEPPSRDLRDYLAEDDKWILGEWVADDENMSYWDAPPKPEWVEHFQNNYMADRARYRFVADAGDRMAEAWRRYENPDQPAETPASTGINLRLYTAMLSLESGGIGQEARLQTALRLTFGVPSSLGKVSRSLFATAAQAEINLIFDFSKLQGASFSLRAPSHSPLFLGSFRYHGDVLIANNQFGLVLNCGNFDAGTVTYREPPATLPSWRLEEDGDLTVRPEGVDASKFTLTVERPDGRCIQDHVRWNVFTAGELKPELMIGAGPDSLGVIDTDPMAGTYRVYLDFQAGYSGSYAMYQGHDYTTYAHRILNKAGALEIQSASIGNGRPVNGRHLVQFEVYDDQDMAVQALAKHQTYSSQDDNGEWSLVAVWPEGGKIRFRNPWPFAVTLAGFSLRAYYQLPLAGERIVSSSSEKTTLQPGEDVDIPLPEGRLNLRGAGALPSESQVISRWTVTYVISDGSGGGGEKEVAA